MKKRATLRVLDLVLGGLLVLALGLAIGSIVTFATTGRDNTRTTAQPIAVPGILECYREVLPGSASDKPRWTDTKFPIVYELEPPISPVGLPEPDSTWLLSPLGASSQIVMLTYDTAYLYTIRDQVGESFRGIASLTPSSIPSAVRERYPIAVQYVIAPNSCSSQ
jgi:hypothetical protein